MSRPGFPPWVVLHIPHDSTIVPDQVRPQFLLTDEELTLELGRMTDHFTHALFAEPPGDAAVVRAPVSRLVVDVERFADDGQELMAKRGMGAIYELTSHLAPLRRKLSLVERDSLMRAWYHPHHQRLKEVVSAAASAPHTSQLRSRCHDESGCHGHAKSPRLGCLAGWRC